MSDDAAQWLTINEAAELHGVTARTIRTWIKEGGHVEARQVKGKRGPEWRIEPPAGHARRYQPASPEADQPSINDQAALVPLATVQQAFSTLQRNYETVEAELKVTQAARLADAETIGNLRGQLAATQAELERLRAMPPGPLPAVESERTGRRWRWPWER